MARQPASDLMKTEEGLHLKCEILLTVKLVFWQHCLTPTIIHYYRALGCSLLRCFVVGGVFVFLAYLICILSSFYFFFIRLQNSVWGYCWARPKRTLFRRRVETGLLLKGRTRSMFSSAFYCFNLNSEWEGFTHKMQKKKCLQLNDKASCMARAMRFTQAWRATPVSDGARWFIRAWNRNLHAFVFVMLSDTLRLRGPAYYLVSANK